MYVHIYTCICIYINIHMIISMDGASQVVLVVKNMPANTEDTRDVGSIPGSGRFSGVGNGSSLLYSCLKNSMDRRSCVNYSPWGHKESDMTEQLSTYQLIQKTF